nr:MAG TPA: minor capsid protein [Caudoviricetes sp.]
MRLPASSCTSLRSSCAGRRPVGTGWTLTRAWICLRLRRRLRMRRRPLRVSEALFYSILRSIVMLFRRRAEDALKAFEGLPEPPPVEHVGDLLTPLMWQARKQAWAAAALFLRGQARKAGVPESWIPPQPGYSPKTIARTIRGTQGALSSPEGMRRLERSLEGHVLAAARRTVADAVDTAPNSIEVIEGALDDLAKDLEEFSETTQKAIVEDVEKVESRRRPHMSLEEAFEKVADRVEEAVRTLDEEELVKERHRSMKVFSDVPDKYRRNSRGELIARPFAFARVCHPNKNGPCGFCAMLASRGPVYKSSESAGIRADRYHDHCFCTCVAVFTSKHWEGKDQQIGFERVYNEVVRDQDLHGVDARRAMDKYFREKLKERK